jgi:hypothetical protein
MLLLVSNILRVFGLWHNSFGTDALLFYWKVTKIYHFSTTSMNKYIRYNHIVKWSEKKFRNNKKDTYKHVRKLHILHEPVNDWQYTVLVNPYIQVKHFCFRILKPVNLIYEIININNITHCIRRSYTDQVHFHSHYVL